MLRSVIVKPPLIATPEQTPSRPATQTVLWVFLGGVSLSVCVRLASEWHWPLPQCILRKLTGIPCPACGCTRSLLAWSNLDLVQAFWFNPLFFLACVGVILWAAGELAEKFFGRSCLSKAEAFLGRRSVWKYFALLAALRWLYLCLMLPK